MCRKSQNARIWVLCFTLVIGIFVVYSISYLNLKPKIICSVDPTIRSAEDFKQNFDDKLFDDISKKYIEMLRRIRPKKQSYWESLLSDLPADDEHAKDIRYLLQRTAENFDNMERAYNKKERLQLIEEAQYLEADFYKLTLRDTKDVSMYDFNTIQQKHNLKKYHQFKETEAIRFVKEIHESWSDIYDCIPEQYQNKYRILSDIEEMFQSALKSSDSDKIFKIHVLLSKLALLFNNELKLSL